MVWGTLFEPSRGEACSDTSCGYHTANTQCLVFTWDLRARWLLHVNYERQNTSETAKPRPGPVSNHQLGSEKTVWCACIVILSQDELLMLHLLLCTSKTAPLLDWKYHTETFNNLCFCSMKRSLPQPTEITFCVSTAWSQSDKCAACLFIIFLYTYILTEAEISPAVQNVWELLYAEAIIFWYITPCMCVFMLPRTTKGGCSSSQKTLCFKTWPHHRLPSALIWGESCENSQPGLPPGHWKTRAVTISLSKESNQKFTSKRHRRDKASLDWPILTFSVYF